MSARPRQTKLLGKPLLLGCLAALSLPVRISARTRRAQTTSASLKPHQAISTNTPPASPEIFNPDPNALELPEPPQTDFLWTRRVFVSTNSPPLPQFNPDPGASLRPATNLPAALFNEPVAPPVFTPPVIPPD